MDKIPNVDINIDVDGNKIYDDTISPITNPTAETLGLIPRAIKAALLPLEKWILNREYSLQETALLLEEKLKNISPEKIVSPEPYVAVPAIQAISYSMDNENLRNLYASLLASSMNADIKNEVHPAFVEIIKQLSPTDAITFRNIIEVEPLPICKLRLQELNNLEELLTGEKKENNGITFTDMVLNGFDLANNIIIPTDKFSAPNLNQCIDNLSRLGLIATIYPVALPDDAYESFKTHPLVIELTSTPAAPNIEYVLIPGTCSSTYLGKNFAKICF